MAPYLLRRHGHYYFRLSIPLDLRALFFGKREVRWSLKTTRYDIAKSSVRAHLYKAERLFAVIRGGLMDDEQIKKLVSDYLSQMSKDFLEARIEAPPLSPEEQGKQLYLHETWLDDAGEDLAAGRHHKMASTADSLLELAKVNGLPETDIPPKDSLEYPMRPPTPSRSSRRRTDETEDCP